MCRCRSSAGTLRLSAFIVGNRRIPMAEYVAVCHDCGWEQPMPKREMAEHAKSVHENRYGHSVTLDV